MKTPREILFERHRPAEPKLDALRENVLAALAEAQGASTLGRLPTPGGRQSHLWVRRMLARLAVGAVPLVRKAWLELIWPSRRAWAGMAALWLAVLATNLDSKLTRSGVSEAKSMPVREVAQALQAQRRLLAELLPPGKPSAVESKPVQTSRPSPRPRSEGLVPFKTCQTNEDPLMRSGDPKAA